VIDPVTGRADGAAIDVVDGRANNVDLSLRALSEAQRQSLFDAEAKTKPLPKKPEKKPADVVDDEPVPPWVDDSNDGAWPGNDDGALPVPVPVPDCVARAVPVWLLVPVPLGVENRESVAVGVATAVADPDPVRVLVPRGLKEDDEVAVPVEFAVREAVLEGVWKEEGVRVAEAVRLPVMVRVELRLGLAVMESVLVDVSDPV
jgi:hypothetical protein